MQIVFLIFLFILGACFGSFLCCQARRLHLREKGTAKSARPTRLTKTANSTKSTSTTKSTARKSSHLGSRSVCLHCGYQLAWHDNLPIISWLILKGKCRHCHHRIGLAEIISEVGTALAFLALGTTIDVTSIGMLPWATFVATLMLTTILIFLAIYDGLYGELPTIFLAMAITLAVVVLIFKTASALATAPFNQELIWHPLVSVAILGGLYLILYLVSRGRWVGDGDWLLGISLGLALASPWLALITLFLANVLACIIMLPAALFKKRKKIYFAPFLVAGFILTLTLSPLLQSLIQSNLL